MLDHQCREVNGTYNCHKMRDHEGYHTHHYNSLGEHRVVTWEAYYSNVLFSTVYES